MELRNSTALSQTSMICFNVKSASCALIHGKQLVLDAAKNQRVQPRTKIHLAADDGREFLTIAKVLEAGAFQHARFKFRQHVHIAALRVEIMVQHRAEQAQFAYAAFTAKTRNLLTINLDGQFGNTHLL